MSSNNYVYVSAKLRALEPQILDQTDIERMVDAPDFNTAFKVLNDTDYADNLLDIEPLNYRDALRQDFSQLYELIKNVVPNKKLFQLLYLERDFLNLRYLFKAKYFQQDVDKLMVTDTIYPAQRLKEYVFDQKDTGLDDDIKQAINDADKIFEKNHEPAVIDNYLTKLFYPLELKLAKKINNDFITKLIKIQINTANLITFLRAKRLDLAKDKVAEKLISQGDIAVSTWLGLYDEDLSALKPLINNYYDKTVVESFDQYSDKKNLFELEKALNDFQTHYCQKAKLIAYGPEVVVAYFWAKKIAVQNTRLIMTGKLNQIATEEIKKTLRQAY